MIIHLCPLAALDDTLRQRYRDQLLDNGERTRLAQFKRAQAADQFLLGRALLRSALGELLGREPSSLRIERDGDDKPQLCDNDGWQFNLSHSRDWVALAVSRDGHVGIDIESSARSNDIDGIAERFFQPQEAEWLQSLPNAERRHTFFTLWTLKEATVKALGRGIAGALAGTGVQLDDSNGAIITLRDEAAWPGTPLCWHVVLDAVAGEQPYHLAVVLLPADTHPSPLQPMLRQVVPLRGSIAT